MIRHADCCAVADFKVIGRDFNAALAQALNLAEKMLKVNYHSRSHNIHGVAAQYSRREQIKNEFAFFVYNGVPGIVAALIARNNVILFAEKVNHSSFAFIAPVNSDNCS